METSATGITAANPQNTAHMTIMGTLRAPSPLASMASWISDSEYPGAMASGIHTRPSIAPKMTTARIMTLDSIPAVRLGVMAKASHSIRMRKSFGDDGAEV